jgi:aspartate ammonia-lyase
LSQSTNDVYPTAIKLALDTYIARLLDALDGLRLLWSERSASSSTGYPFSAIALSDKALEFVDAVKLGRAQLQTQCL